MNSSKMISRQRITRKKIAIYVASAVVIALLLGTLLTNPPNHSTSRSSSSESLLSLVSSSIGIGAFQTILQEVTGQINARQYTLPVNLFQAGYYETLRGWLQLAAGQEALLSQNGFVVARINNFGTLSGFYDSANRDGMPILITTDAVLHTYHVLFDATLKDIETGELIGELNNTLTALYNEAKAEAASAAGTTLEAASQINFMYLEVAHSLMEPSFVPTTLKAQQELQLISNHASMTYSPIFGYVEDYTQYVPRGHYTESKQLEQYFEAMMWLGRMRFGLVSGQAIDVEQTRAGILLTWMIMGNQDSSNVWQRIYSVTEFFVGASDDLTLEDYSSVLNKDGITVPEQIMNESTVTNIAHELLKQNEARILGTYAVANPDLPQEEQLQGALNQTAGLRFMGQRFIPDSYMFDQLVYPQVGTMDNPRLLPKGLDIASVLGSDQAKQILNKTESQYENYTNQIEKLGTEFADLNTPNWTQNLYWSWLYAANTTLTQMPAQAKYPTFMTTPAWSYEKLQTFEGTWTELRHDTILYAKQSYTLWLGITLPPPSAPPYVEPCPETYRAIVGLANMTINGLTQLGILSTGTAWSDAATQRLTSFMDASELFLNASTVELEGKTMSQDMQNQIIRAAKTISQISSSGGPQTPKAAIAADVHTDPNSNEALEEALGNFSILVVVYANPDGRLFCAAGPVFNYYEFTVPTSNRLTDEAWRAMLSSNQPPQPPEWTNNFAG